jgi:hypothetical protein
LDETEPVDEVLASTPSESSPKKTCQTGNIRLSLKTLPELSPKRLSKTKVKQSSGSGRKSSGDESKRNEQTKATSVERMQNARDKAQSILDAYGDFTFHKVNVSPIAILFPDDDGGSGDRFPMEAAMNTA